MVVFVMIFQRRVGHFKPGFLSSQGSKLDNLSAHKIENFLNFSKLTQLLSVGQFLRPLGAFKTEKPNRRIYCSSLVDAPLLAWALQSSLLSFLLKLILSSL